MAKDTADHRLPPVQPYRPTTFLERGVAVPFTTPLLSGTRARPGQHTGVELIVPNPSGGQGAYVMPWAGVSQFCSPTVHDVQLSDRILGLPSVTPAIIRRAVRETAAEGWAGDDAKEAARCSGASDHDDRLLTNFLLLMALIDQVDPSRKGGAITYQRTSELEEYARQTIASIAPQIGQPEDAISEMLEGLAEVLYAVGVHTQANAARVPRQLDKLRAMTGSVAEWSRQQTNEIILDYAEMVCTVAEHTLGCASKALQGAHALTTNMTALLRRWTREPDKVAQFAARSEWLLDGWERICLLWTIATNDASPEAALVEMAQLVPILPLEAAGWMDDPSGVDASPKFRRKVKLNEDWRTGSAVFGLVERNEQMLALAA